MGGYLGALRSTVGTKFLVAATGIILVLYVIGHLLGNLQIYLGPDAVNGYAAFLKSKPSLLWGVRFILLAAFIIHIWGTLRLTLMNRSARPAAYEVRKPVQSTFASRTMLISGLTLLAFVIYHLMHLTLGVIRPEFYQLRDSLGRHDVYSMTVLGFQQPAISIPYIVAMGLLGLHLAHGTASIFQSMGWRKPQFIPLIEGVGLLVALFVVIGNIAIPLTCLLGLVEPTQGTF